MFIELCSLLSEFRQEVRRIRSQHLNDRDAIDNHRVKGKINVTRAFGAGYLKQVTKHTLMFPFSGLVLN